MYKKFGVALVIIGFIAGLIALRGITVGHCGAYGGKLFGTGIQAVKDSTKLRNEECNSSFRQADGSILVMDQQYKTIIPVELVLVAALLITGGIILILKKYSPLELEKPKEE